MPGAAMANGRTYPAPVQSLLHYAFPVLVNGPRCLLQALMQILSVVETLTFETASIPYRIVA